MAFITSRKVKEILKWDEHKISVQELCGRFGYRPDYLMQVGLTNDYAKKQ